MVKVKVKVEVEVEEVDVEHTFRKEWRIHQESKMEVSKVLFRCVWSPGV